MKTSLHLEAPSDLSVGRVRIDGQGETVAEWIATPGNRSYINEDAKPGFYSVEVTPTGLSPQAVVFEVKEGKENRVVLPTFSALASAGSNTSFYSTATHFTSIEAPNLDTIAAVSTVKIPDFFPSERPIADPLKIAEGTKKVSVALSQEVAGSRESYDFFKGTHRLELDGNGFSVQVDRDNNWFTPEDRVRVSISIEAVRIERCLVPMYLGGTTISVVPSSLSLDDVAVQILPTDTRLRAMVRALGAGTIAEATAVKETVPPPSVDALFPVSSIADPWAVLVYSLLTLRFPSVFPKLDDKWGEELVIHAGWAFDAHVIRAHQILTSAAEDAAARTHAAVAAAKHLTRAQAAGSPYYSYANELFREIVAVLSEPDQEDEPSLPLDTRAQIDRVAKRWSREFALQRGAGVAFSWLARDLKALKDAGVLVPNRRSSGILTTRNATVVFHGKLAPGKITIGNFQASPPRDDRRSMETPSTAADANPECLDYPALYRSLGPLNDPNKTRFGERAERDGFRIDATFGTAKRHGFVAITLLVTASQTTLVNLAADVWFFLHPTFSPSRIKARFKGRRAVLSVEAWGGFTVGVWIPSVQVELECDLALLADAPRIIREL